MVRRSKCSHRFNAKGRRANVVDYQYGTVTYAVFFHNDGSSGIAANMDGVACIQATVLAPSYFNSAISGFLPVIAAVHLGAAYTTITSRALSSLPPCSTQEEDITLKKSYA